MKRFFFLLISTLLTSILVCLLACIWLAYTHSGLKFMIKTLPYLVPGQLTIGSAAGEAAHTFMLTNISYHHSNMKFTLKSITLSWLSEKLIFHRTVDIKFLKLEGLNILSLSSSSSRPSTGTNIHFPLFLPRYGEIKLLQLNNIVYQNTTIPNSQWSLQAEIKNNSGITYNIGGKILNGNLTITGNAVFSPVLQWTLMMRGTHFDFSELPAHISSNISFDLSGEGKNSTPYPSGKITLSNLHGKVNHYPIEGEANFLMGNDRYQLSNLYVHSGNNSIRAYGDINKLLEAHWKISLNDLSEFIPQATGHFISQGDITGNKDLPKFKIILNGKNIHLTSPHIDINKISAKAEGTADNHQLYFSLQGKPFNLNFILQGKYAFQNWIGNLKRLNFTHPSIGSWKVTQPAALHINPKYFILHNLKINGYKSYCILDAEWEKNKNWSFLERGNIYIKPLNITLKNSRINIKSNPKEIIYHSQFISGKGHLQIQGKATLTTTPFQLEAKIEGSDFLAIDNPHYQVWASPSLHLKKINNQWHITGKLLIPEAHIISPDYNKKSIVLPKDVVIEDNQNQPKNDLLQIYSDIQLIFGNKIDIHAEGLEAELMGSLRLQDSPAHPTISNGSLTIVNGRYQAYGQTLEISEGKLFFNNTIVTNPILQIKAVKHVTLSSNAGPALGGSSTSLYQPQKAIVGVNVAGALDEPQLSLFSSPAILSQPDILSYMLFGKPTDSISSADAALLLRATSAMNLGNKQFEQILQNIQNASGLKKLSVESVHYFDPATSSVKETTSLVLSKALSPKLYLSYSIGLLDPINIFSVKYLISDEWTLQSTSSPLATGIDLFYSPQ